MGGVFVLDLIRDLPLSDPMEYALRYFAQYPALAFNWYLPGFYAAEAAMFSIFGASEAVARGTVFTFCLIGASVWFAWLRRGWGATVAFLATALFLSPPLWNLWSRSVMLEAPVVAMLIVSVWALQRYMDTPTWTRSIVAGAALAMALMIKQTAGFILPALLLYALATPRRFVLWRWRALPAYLIVGVALLAVAAHAVKFGSQGLTSVLSDAPIEAGGSTPRWSIDRWLLFPKVLIQTWGPYLTLLSAIGALLPRRAGERYLPMIYLWLVCWYVAASLVLGGPNAARYTMYAFPALALLAVRPILYLQGMVWLHAAAVGLLVGGIGFNVWRSFDEPIPRLDGYRPVADFVHGTGTRAPILFAGKHDGNFIFHLRRLDDSRSHVVLRADKILVSLAVHKYFGMQSHVASEADIQALVERYGVEYIVIESPDIIKLKEFALLARLVQGPAFERVNTLPVQSAGGAVAPQRVEVYRLREFKAVNDVEIVIPLPHMGREIRFKPVQSR